MTTSLLEHRKQRLTWLQWRISLSMPFWYWVKYTEAIACTSSGRD